MESFVQCNASGSRHCSVRAVIVHDLPAVDVEDASVVALGDEFPYGLFRNADVTFEFISEVVLNACVIDGRFRHGSGAGHFGHAHFGHGCESSVMETVADTMCKSGLLNSRDELRLFGIEPDSSARAEAFAEGPGADDGAGIESDRAIVKH